MNAPLDELYLSWLYAEVAPVKLRRASRTYWSLFRQLYQKEFVWIVANDDNRVEDGKDLRYKFLEEIELVEVDQKWMGLGCSVLELLIALSYRLEFETEPDGRRDQWFWQLLENLGLARCPDSVYGEGITEQEINDILDRFIWRQYDYDGRGGLFPLAHPEKDQRDVEIWYQLNAYLLERN